MPLRVGGRHIVFVFVACVTYVCAGTHSVWTVKCCLAQGSRTEDNATEQLSFGKMVSTTMMTGIFSRHAVIENEISSHLSFVCI